MQGFRTSAMTMIRLLSLAILLAVHLPLLHAQSQTDAAALLDAARAQYDRVNDYKARIHAVIDMTGLSVPPMDAVMYFKKPDRIQIESDGFAMLPRDAVGFHPAMFAKDEYDLVLQGSETIGGVSCSKVKMLARSDTLRLQRAMVYIDAKRALILRMDFDPGAGASATADFTYTRVDGKYWLPSRIDVEMESPMRGRRPGQRKKSDESTPEKARIRMTYTDYVVNRGIPDSVFDKDAAPSKRAKK